jgi:choloylglycine hydrolase
LEGSNPRRRYFFELATSPNVLWASLDSFDLTPGSPVQMLDPDEIWLAGDVAGHPAPVGPMAL